MCQVCHTQTKFYTQTAYFVSPATANHETGKACVTCHDHKSGLAANCVNCHGTDSATRPPTVTDTDKNFEAAPPAVATGATVFVAGGGLHLQHVDQANFRSGPLLCAACHENQSHQGTTDVDWGTLAESNLPWPSSVVVTPATGAVSAGWVSPNPNCANWCHGVEHQPADFVGHRGQELRTLRGIQLARRRPSGPRRS